MSKQSRREFIQAGVAATAAAMLSAETASATEPVTVGKRPNILFLLTDDQRWDSMGCMGNKTIKTPNLDHLASVGVLFKNNFVTTAICCTSRATILSGRYGGSMDLHRFDKPLPDEIWQTSYPMMLKKAGYRTGFLGKFGLGDPLPEKDFDFWRGFPGQGDFYEGEIFKGQHLTDRLSDQAAEFLDGCSDNQPFCLSVSFKAPHTNPEIKTRPLPPDKRDLDLYEDIQIPLSKTATEEARQKLPPFLRDSEGHVRWLQWYENAPATKDGNPQPTIRDYYRLITGVDRAVGEMVEELRKRGLLENTVIVYTSDNGYFLGERRFEGKWLMYEESIRTPLLIFDPRLPSSRKGSEVDEMTLNLDIAPTLLDLASIPSPEGMKGRSMLPLLAGEPLEWRADWYYEHLFPHPKIPKNEGVRNKEWKYIRYPETSPVYEELYHLTVDPFEETNLAGDTGCREILEKMRARCAQLKGEMIQL